MHITVPLNSSCSSMFKALLYGPAAVLQVIMIGGLITMTIGLMMMTFEAYAQPTVNDDETFCQPRTWKELVHEIKADMTNMKLTNRATLDQVKNVIGSRQQAENETKRAVQKIKEDLGEMKHMLGSRQKTENETARAVSLITEGLAEVKSLFGSRNEEETGTARDVQQIKEDMAQINNLFGSRQQTENETLVNLTTEALAEVKKPP